MPHVHPTPGPHVQAPDPTRPGRPGSRSLRAALAIALACGVLPAVAESRTQKTQDPIAVVVMDPLAKELACACVRGYAQRNYHQLAQYLAGELKHPTAVSFSEDVADSASKLDPGQHAIFVGKQSVIERDAAAAGLSVRPLARLTAKDGSTTLTGVFVARRDDAARTVKDLAGRRVLFGSANADEKYAAALATLRAAGIATPDQPETRDSCSDAGLDIVDSTETPPPVGVISSYALPLLEGCGSIKKGDLKIIGTTEPVPFVTVYVGASMPEPMQHRLLEALLRLKKKAKLLAALESRDGFVPFAGAAISRTAKPQASSDWPDWRGPRRDGTVDRLPDSLPASPRVVWKRPAMNGGLAGIAVADDRVLVADRDVSDRRDALRCLDARDGSQRWVVEYAAPGKLDYGQFPRATPVVRDGRVYGLGAFGDLHCVDLATGKVRWKKHLVRDLGGQLPKWGSCSTPLLLDDLIVSNPGGARSSLVALDARNGRLRWSTPGSGAAYASLIAAELGGVRQIVGYDAETLGGWDPKSGTRLWSLRPESEGDFNVPSPVVVDGHLLVATENNGTRLYAFGPGGQIVAKPVAEYGALAPDTASPVRAGVRRILGAHLGLHGLEWGESLKCLWKLEDPAFEDHVSLIATPDRVLVLSLAGELLLVATDGSTPRVISRLRLFEDDAEIYAHPALVGDRLYVRGPSAVYCFDLSTPDSRPLASASLDVSRPTDR